MLIIKMHPLVGDFAENKDVAKSIRESKILPTLASKQSITFDFADVTGATQSFIHALISEALRQYPDSVYDDLFYKNANPEIQEIIKIVYHYMQESLN